MALSDLFVRRIKATEQDQLKADGDGLYLFIPARGKKSWHFRYYWAGKRARFSLGTYPEISLREARSLRDDARAQLCRGLNPHNERKRQRQEVILAGRHTFFSVYTGWLAHREHLLDQCRQGSYAQIQRVFTNDVLPALRHLSIHEVTQAHLLDVVGKVEKRQALTIASKLRSWLYQLFSYAKVVVPGITANPAVDLKVVALPLPPVEHNPFLRLAELPPMLQALRKCPGHLNTQLGLRLLLLTGVRTGELRHATPDQFDLDQGLWFIPVERLKQRKQLTSKKRKRASDIPPYIVPLSLQAQEIVRYLLDHIKPAQVYLLPGVRNIKATISENTLNVALKRMGYEGRLTGHGIRATISTALNELGYLQKWVDAQLSHSDPDKISASYNHAEYVQQRRVMMQDWADRLDLFEQNRVEVASKPLTITLQGLPAMTGHPSGDSSELNPNPSGLLVASPVNDSAGLRAPIQRLPAVELPDYALPRPSKLQRERMTLLEIFNSAHNLPVTEYAHLEGKSRTWAVNQIAAGNLLSIRLGHRGARVPDWHLDPNKRQLIKNALAMGGSDMDSWKVYHVLGMVHPRLGGLAPVEAVSEGNLEQMTQLVCHELNSMPWPIAPYTGLPEISHP